MLVQIKSQGVFFKNLVQLVSVRQVGQVEHWEMSKLILKDYTVLLTY